MSECPVIIQGTRLRATLVDACGAPVGGDCAQVVTDGFISVTMTDNIESPDEFKRKTAGGNFCLNQRSEPELNWIEVAIALCQVNPELVSFLTGARLIYDGSTPPVAVGWGTDTDVYATASFALEVWTNLGKVRGGPACGPLGTRYGYLLLPWLIEGTFADLTIENGPADFTINTITSEGNDWGVGPYDVVLDSPGGSPSPLLEAIPTTRHRHMQLTDLAPPDSVCGCQELVLAS